MTGLTASSSVKNCFNFIFCSVTRRGRDSECSAAELPDVRVLADIPDCNKNCVGLPNWGLFQVVNRLSSCIFSNESQPRGCCSSDELSEKGRMSGKRSGQRRVQQHTPERGDSGRAYETVT